MIEPRVAIFPESTSARVVAFAGSLRRGSFNRALLRAAQELAPNRMEIDIIEIGDLPFYNADVEADGDPPVVARFKDRLHAAVGLLIATPEHNDGIPGVLTTAIDWGSRLPGRHPVPHMTKTDEPDLHSYIHQSRWIHSHPKSSCLRVQRLGAEAGHRIARDPHQERVHSHEPVT